MSGVAINILLSDILFFIAGPCAIYIFTNNSRSDLLQPFVFLSQPPVSGRLIVFLHLLKPLNICHEQSCAADLDFLVLSLLGAGLAVAVYQLDRMGELVVVNADEQSHVAAAQKSAGGRDLCE